jgi:hypothetical protein
MTSVARSRSWILSLAVLGCVAAACSSAPEPPTGSTSEAILPGVHPPPLPVCLSNASTCSSGAKETPGFDPAYGPPSWGSDDGGADADASVGCGVEDTAFEANLVSHFCTPETYYTIRHIGDMRSLWAISFCEGFFPVNGTTEGWIECDSCTGNPPRDGWHAVAWLLDEQCPSLGMPAEGCSCVECLQESQNSSVYEP